MHTPCHTPCTAPHPGMRMPLHRALFLALFCLAVCTLQPALLHAQDAGWRIRIKDAAVVAGGDVRLGEIADAHGPIPPELWNDLANRTVMPAPADLGRAMSIAKNRLQPLLREAIGEYEELVIYPGNLAIQRGGAVLHDQHLRQIATQGLVGALAHLSGDVSLQDFRLPTYVFLAHPGQRVELEPTAAAPGRLNLRFSIMDGDTQVRRFTGSVMVDVWAPVFCAVRPLNKGETLDPSLITTVSKNLAHISGTPWDGTGGPWMMARPVGTEQPIFMADLVALPVIKRGTMVTLRYQSATVSLTVKVEALANGGVGEIIPVKNLESGRTIHATVVDASTVIINGMP